MRYASGMGAPDASQQQRPCGRPGWPAVALLAVLIAAVADGQITGFPWFEDFQSFGLGTPGGMQNGWSQTGPDQFDWTVDRSGTSSDTGPSVDHTLGTSSGTYLYAEASNPRVPGDEAHLLSPALVTAGLAVPVVQFWYHMYGSDMGTLHVDVFSGGMWTDDVWLLGGQQQTASSDPWRSSGPVFLTSFSSPVQLRFRAERGSNTKSDMAIDDVLVFDADTDDVEVLAVLAPVSTCLGGAEIVRVTLANHNLVTPVTGFPISYSVTGPLPAAPPAEVVGVVIPPGGTADFSFLTTASLVVPGSYQVSVTAALPGDADPSNDTVLSQVIVPPGQLGSFPHLEDFEGFTVGTPGVLAGGWEQEPTHDHFDWTVDAGGTPSQSGPAVDHTLGTTSGTYLYTETSAPVGAFQEAHLLSPCLDTGSLTQPVVRFWYHMFGRDTGSLHLDVAASGSWVESVWSAVGQQQAGSQEAWGWSGPIDLGGLSPPLRLRFRGVNGATVTSDIAIDDVWIVDGTMPDVGVVSIDSPVSDCALGQQTVRVTIASFRSVGSITSFPVAFTVTGPAPQAPAAELVMVAIPPLATISFDFSAPADLLAHGVHTIEAFTLLPGDIDPRNDRASVLVTHLPAVDTFPFLEDFEAGDGGWVASGTSSSWELGAPAAPVINSAASGGAVSWVTDLNGNHNADEDSQVTSPCFDLSALADPWVALEVWWNSEFSWDGAALQTSTDMGSTWSTLGASGDPGNWYTDDTIDGRPGGQRHGWTGRAATADGSGGWVLAAHELTGLTGAPSVRLRIVFASDSSVEDEGFAFDSVWIGDGNPLTPGCPLTLCGDCNTDGVVDVLDALLAAQAEVGVALLTPTQFANCNVEGALEPDPGAEVTVLDALRLAQFAVGSPVPLDCCL